MANEGQRRFWCQQARKRYWADPEKARDKSRRWRSVKRKQATQAKPKNRRSVKQKAPRN